jgi:hypothetical protein
MTCQPQHKHPVGGQRSLPAHVIWELSSPPLGQSREQPRERRQGRGTREPFSWPYASFTGARNRAPCALHHRLCCSAAKSDAHVTFRHRGSHLSRQGAQVGDETMADHEHRKLVEQCISIACAAGKILVAARRRARRGGSGAIRASGMRPASLPLQSMAGLPRASTRST